MADRMRLVLSSGDELDVEELDSLTGQLRKRLLELDVDDVKVERSDAAPPPGAKPGELITVGALAVTLAPAVFRPALRVVEAWLRNRPVRTVKVEVDGRILELGQASPEEQRLLVEAFLEGIRDESAVQPSTDPE
ncbi:hypothetical protein [Streptomyces cylindrosporus]|uniref:Uncharacterized protein n=1 Tax=Streptomyces cylindrosporus TaxID=2927583 RepID=A0ABS9YHF6_9ACTN|nr:hypothetical protein [Streptomyces cylindrosporus]MCI3276615.1 hypothetical protein [Streptomyces cylindrosporus]